MQEVPIHIVCTRSLKHELIAVAKSAGIFISAIKFLQIKTISTAEFEDIILSSEFPLVFTSTHAVHAVSTLKARLNNRTVFALDGNTSASAKSAGFKILATAPDATSLAIQIAAQRIKAILHCTTVNRRDELKIGLESCNITYQAIEVYEKEFTPKKVDPFDGIMFFSPSQIDAFLTKNKLSPDLPAFCIGATTAQHLANLQHKNILKADQASAVQLVQTVLKYYKKENEPQTFIT